MDNNYTDALHKFYEKNHRMPSYSEMMSIFGFKSKNAVYRLVNKMVSAGIVAKDRIGRLIPSSNFSDLPVAGLVKAGLPSQADELRDTINLEEYLVEHKASTYMLEVDGDSMIEAHIADGDMVIVEKTNKAKDKDIVIANVDGEFTMKYFREKNGKVWLEAANKAYKPIYPERELTIIAKVRAVVRKY
jgi:SOS regulatory protein LexA